MEVTYQVAVFARNYRKRTDSEGDPDAWKGGTRTRSSGWT